MVSQRDCRARADANWTLAQALSAQGDYGWGVTVTFYAGLHHVNELLVRAGKYADDVDHSVRQLFLHDHHPAIESTYSFMLAKSIRTRYEVGFTPSKRYYKEQAKHYAFIKDYVDRALAGSVPGV